MKSILRQLYTGEIHPCEQPIASQKYRNCRNRYIESSESLCQTLQAISPELEEKYNTAIEQHSAIWSIETEEMFYYGLSLGLRLFAEVAYL